MAWHGYIAVERLVLTNPQWASLQGTLEGLGPGADDQPANVCHWMRNTTDDVDLYEANFDDAEITVAAFKQYVANALGVGVGTVSNAADTITLHTTSTDLEVFSQGGSDRIKVGFMAQAGAAWAVSGVESREYARADGSGHFLDTAIGDDGGDGKTPFRPWETTAPVTAGPFNPKDRILAKRGNEWRGTIELPSSGDAEYPVFIGPYGAGERPIFNGSDLIGTWTGAPGPIDVGGDGGPRDDGLSVNHTYIDFTNPANESGTIDHIELYLNSIEAGSTVKVGVFYHVAGDDYICRNVVSLSCTGGAGAKLTFDAPGDFAAFAVTAGDYIGVYGNTVVDLERGNAGGLGTDNYFGDATDGGQYTFAGVINNRRLALYMTGTYVRTNVWQATVTTEPNQVFFDNVRGTVEASVDALDGVREWYWEGNVLYVYSVGDPDTVYTSPGIEASARIICIYFNHESYITLQGIHATKSNGQYRGNIEEFNSASGAVVGLRILDVESDYAFSHGINVVVLDVPGPGTVTDLVITSSHSHHNGEDGLGHGIRVGGDLPAAFADCHVYENETNDNEQEGISFGYGTASIYQNASADDGQQAGGGAGIITRPYTVDTLVYRNYIDTPGAEGIWVDGRNTTGLELYYNIIDSPVGAGITLSQDADGTKIHNNIIWAADNGIRLGTTAQVTNIELRNNLMDGGLSAANIQVLNGSTLTSDRNCFDENAAWAFDVGTVQTSWAQWQALGHDANGLFEDAKMVNPPTDFHLQVGSPCRDAGEDVGLSEDYDGVSVPQETNPAIGAYEYMA